MKKVGFFQSVRLKLTIVYILLLLLGIQVIGSYFVGELEDRLEQNFNESIDGRLRSLTYSLQNSYETERDDSDSSLESDVQSLINDFNEDDIQKVQVINYSNRRVIATYDDDLTGSDVGKKADYPMITGALLYKNADWEMGIDPNTENRIRRGARPVESSDGEEVHAAIYYEADMSGVYGQLQQINNIFARGTILAITVTALLGILVARTITKPLSEMRRQAQIMATGDFSQKVSVHGNDEIGQLGITFNDLNDKLKQSQATTEGERRKLSSVLSNMSDGVIATDRLGAITLMNAPASKLIGQSFEEVQGQSLIDILDLTDQINEISDIESIGSIIVDLSSDDKQLLLKANFSVVQDENEEMDGFITVISDVTEQEKVDQERREFVSNVSHELRTPLTTMRSYLEALTDGAWEDKEIAPRFLDVTQNETDRMIRLVNDLLQLSKMDRKDTGLFKEKVEFIEYFSHVIDRFEMNRDEKNTFNRELSAQNLFVWIDKDKITQVLDNIISNAIKYSPEGGTITFKAETLKKQLLVSVSDQGMGMPSDTVDKIFDRFYRVDKARSREMGGTGLGLAIAREIIESHHGQIWANSQEGKGTTVFFTLPLINQKRRKHK
ncbi:PAS domain-containing sensor histidine kinase [Halobacillus andaensis]|uniref:histidine kinase n=1 Tax=Halobacillus andaensis TaxID=1176239 RepID=A0A917EVF2_HALAA|nr:cell wall metabolism sensor histidine kinase WalK [Halobacillus andaensis]MBP2004933.1 two-component system sensor histidine kinase VicK [Halobacillus andaensis]GGF17782.1 PAS domain-containing sensor histidine kinase [Halobacillus andaensis]